MSGHSAVQWAECSLIIGTGCRVQVFSLILDSSVGLSAGIQSAGDLVSETLWVRILHSAEEDNLSPFDMKIACLCQSIEINNKYVCMYVRTYVRTYVRMMYVCWWSCLSLEVVSSVHDNLSVPLWVYMRFPVSGYQNQTNKYVCMFDSKTACLCQSIKINNNKHVCVYRQSKVRMPNGSGIRWAECLLIIQCRGGLSSSSF